jgi:hypothetical protein
VLHQSPVPQIDKQHPFAQTRASRLIPNTCGWARLSVGYSVYPEGHEEEHRNEAHAISKGAAD